MLALANSTSNILVTRMAARESAINPKPAAGIIGAGAEYPVVALAPGTELNQYRIKGVIGEGGFSIVYAAEDMRLQRTVAIKEYLPTSFASRTQSSTITLRSERHRASFQAGLRSFVEEAKMLARFKHTALVEVLQFWEQNGTAYMVMPYYRGHTLRDVLGQQRGLCTQAWLQGVFGPVTDALTQLHEQNLYHRDIAPDNILIQENNAAVLLDLGSARHVIGDEHNPLTVIVKPGYAPIEQYAEASDMRQGPWTDIYSLGAVLYLAITGTTPVASVTRIIKDTLPLLADGEYPGFSTEFLAGVDAALALQPQDRPQSIAELREILSLGGPHEPGDQPAIGDEPAEPMALAAEPAAPPQPTSQPDAADEQPVPAPDNASAAPAPVGQPNETGAQASALPDPFNVRRSDVGQASDIGRFADVQPLLAGQRSRSSEQIKVPQARTDESESIYTTETASAAPARPGWVVPTGALAGFAVLLLAALLLFGGSDQEAPTADTAANDRVSNRQPTSPEQNPVAVAEAPVAEAPRETNPATPGSSEFLADSQPDTSAHANWWAWNADQEQTTTAASSQPIASGFNRNNQPDDSASASRRGAQQAAEADAPTVAQQHATAQKPRSESPLAAPRQAQANPTPAQLTRPEPTPPTGAGNTNAQQQTEVAAPEADATATASLRVRPWAEVWLDGEKLGVTPPLNDIALAPGRYQLELRVPGSDPITQQIELNQQQHLLIEHDFHAEGSTRVESLDDGLASQAPLAVEAPAVVVTNSTSADTAGAVRQDTAEAGSTNPQQATEPPVSEPIASERPVTSVSGIARVALSVSPWGEVWVNGENRGVTPPLNRLSLPTGEHTLEIRHPDFPTITERVEISPGRDLTLHFDFEARQRAQR